VKQKAAINRFSKQIFIRKKFNFIATFRVNRDQKNEKQSRQLKFIKLQQQIFRKLKYFSQLYKIFFPGKGSVVFPIPDRICCYG
jgi:hypothetical protein